MDFPYSLVKLEHTVILRISGYLNRLGVKQLRDVLLENYAEPSIPVIINFSNGEPSSLLVAIFFEILDLCGKDPHKISFCNVDQPTRNALGATGILAFCQIYASENEAREMLK